MSGYRDDGYDANEWAANAMKHRPRRYWVRWGLVGGLAFVAAIPVFEMLTPGHADGVFPNVMPLSVLLITTSVSSPFARQSWLTKHGFERYDEYERDALLAAARRAYLVNLIVIGLLFLWLTFAARAGWPMPQTSRQWGAVGYATVMMMLSLPIMLAEFMVPLPDAEDEPL
ncbi:hypothetical protein V3I01_14385 [Sphingomonas sp. gentR]|jgi:hypothetical protein|uniref:hypothetical protein n=1 Tax=unclassified Sphingomonas TaxID=196159 RepID=UPI000972A833|nr:hypothetical protein [Sphingomonas sp. LK11]APX67214.1 hypothetical protein AV944_16775 [Sphingomonas sp. LK11]